MSSVQDLWSFKYHPKTMDDMILSDGMRDKLSSIIEKTPNVTLSGSPGVGKGTFVDIYIEELEFEVKRINGSMSTGIDMVRDDILSFASAMGYSDTKKLVYINEADRISPHAQDALDQLIEDTQDLTRYILVCNEPQRITSPIVSRCPIIFYEEPPIKDIAKHCIDILKKEDVEYDTKDVITLVKQTGTDIRHTINTLQLNVFKGVLSSNINISSTSQAYDDVVTAMRTCDPSQVRKVLRSNAIDYTKLYKHIYELIMESDDEIFKNEVFAIIEVTDAAYRNETASSISEITFLNMMFKLLREGCL